MTHCSGHRNFIREIPHLWDLGGIKGLIVSLPLLYVLFCVFPRLWVALLQKCVWHSKFLTNLCLCLVGNPGHIRNGFGELPKYVETARHCQNHVKEDRHCQIAANIEKNYALLGGAFRILCSLIRSFIAGTNGSLFHNHWNLDMPYTLPASHLTFCVVCRRWRYPWPGSAARGT